MEFKHDGHELRIHVNVNHHFPEGTPDSSIRELLRQVLGQGTIIMSRLSNIAAKVSAGDATIIQDIEAVLAQNEAATQAAVAKAVQAALDAHQVDDDAQSAILEAADQAISDEHTKLQGVLNPTPPEPEPPVT